MLAGRRSESTRAMPNVTKDDGHQQAGREIDRHAIKHLHSVYTPMIGPLRNSRVGRKIR